MMGCKATMITPLLEKYGFTSWFMIPPRFIQEETKYQREYNVNQSIRCRINYSERIAMSWDELRDLLRRKHQVCSHTY